MEKTEKYFDDMLHLYQRLLIDYLVADYFRVNYSNGVWDREKLKWFIKDIKNRLEVNYPDDIPMFSFAIEEYIMFLLKKHRVIKEHQITVYSIDDRYISKKSCHEYDAMKRKFYYERTKYNKEKKSKELEKEKKDKEDM